MRQSDPRAEYLVLSRGQWDADAPPERIQEAIDAFYVWLDQHITAGTMRTGQRLAKAGATVSRRRVVTDGPYSESKEVIGGYWFVLAGSLEEAAAIAAQNPCMQYGLFYEIRPVEPARASAYAVTTETPARR